VIAAEARVALYYAPAQDDPLWRRGADWLGRDPATNARGSRPAVPGIDDITAEPRLYGFHATLKPPMRLRHGKTLDALADAAAQVASGVPQFDLPPLEVANVHGFLALHETQPSTALQALADACVAGLDEFRAPPDAAELARRRRSGLPPAQERMLIRWGYRYVFATFFFHMTLTRRLTEPEHDAYRPMAEAFFAAALQYRRRVADICLFVQAVPGAPFMLAERIPLTA
jgi:putative phosphonate metabolism protein